MSKYLWRKNYTARVSDQEKAIRAKIAFKTQEIHWLETQASVIALISIDSAFHDGMEGNLKMDAFMSTIKQHVKGRVTVLISDRAHIRTSSLKYGGNLDKAFELCKDNAQGLVDRYRTYFEKCNVAFWHSYIYQAESFDPFLKLVKNLYDTDPVFRSHLLFDAEASYTVERMQDFSNKGLFIERTIEDILEQCACILVLANKGYKFQFYPGRPYASTEYVNEVLIPKEKVCWVSVFLSIEKKTILDFPLSTSLS